jgi:hypothetical protein
VLKAIVGSNRTLTVTPALFWERPINPAMPRYIELITVDGHDVWSVKRPNASFAERLGSLAADCISIAIIATRSPG